MTSTILWAFCGTQFIFLMTTLGASLVFFLRTSTPRFQSILPGFAGGVMTAAAVWSLLLPAIEQTAGEGRLPAWLPAAAGLSLGALFLTAADALQGGAAGRDRMLFTAITLHNIPEGMAVGVVYAGLLSGSGLISAGGALALTLGIAIQNFPEGAIISMPLYAEGKSRSRSFWLGLLSGAVEPLFGAMTIALVGLIVPAMPYLLSFAAGAMLYVVVEELIPEMSAGEHSNIGVIAFAVGFSLMMALDVALG